MNKNNQLRSNTLREINAWQPTRIPPFTHRSRQGGTGLNRGAHGITPECQARKNAVGRELTDTAPFSRRRNVPYLTSKKANITRADKIKNPHRAIKDIKYARILVLTVHRKQKDFGKNINHNLV